MGSEAQKTVADRVKAKGGALRDRKTRLNLRLGYGRRHGVYVSMSTLSTLNCVVCMCVFVCVIIGRMQHHRVGSGVQSHKPLAILTITILVICSALSVLKIVGTKMVYLF
jgi:uncharacterized membrane protein